MDQSNTTKSTVAQQIAQAVKTFQEQRTGVVPKAVTVVMGENTLVVTLHGVLSRAEQELVKSPEGAAQVQKFHRQLFDASSEVLRHEIKKITGVEVQDVVADIEPTDGTVVHVFTTGTMVQVFQLAQGVPTDNWSDNGKWE